MLLRKKTFGTILIPEVLDRDGNGTGKEVAIKRQHRPAQASQFEKEANRERHVAGALRAIGNDNLMCLRDSYYESIGNNKFHCLVFDLMDADLHTWLKARKFTAVRKRVEVHSADSRMLNSSAFRIFSSETLIQGVLLLEVFTFLALPGYLPCKG